MAGMVLRIDAIQVFSGAEDLSPPHVHAVRMSEGWTARFRSSFLSDVTGLYRGDRGKSSELPMRIVGYSREPPRDRLGKPAI